MKLKIILKIILLTTFQIIFLQFSANTLAREETWCNKCDPSCTYSRWCPTGCSWTRDIGCYYDEPCTAGNPTGYMVTSCWVCYCPDSQVCNPGQWDACGTHGCGSQYSARCNSAGTGWDCVYNPGGCSGGGGGGCTPTAPQTPSLNSPANGSNSAVTSTVLNWNAISNWGNTCSSRNNRYLVNYREQSTGNCPTSGYTQTSTNSNTTTLTVNNLNIDSRYCWYLLATNGERTSSRSPIWTFTTIRSPLLDDNDFSFTQTCANNISGNASINGTNNPITFYTEYSFIGGNEINEINEVLLAITPNDVRNANIVSEASLAQASEDYFMARIILNHTNLTNSEFQIVNTNSSPYYSASATQGNLTNSKNTATLLNINQTGPNSTYIEQIDNDTIRVYWTIRFEDNYKYKPNGDLYNQIINANIYSSALREYAPDQWISSTNSSIPRSLEKINSWDINVQIPQISISNSIIIDKDHFDINWNVDGYGLDQVDGYMWTDNTNLNLRRYSPSPNQNFTITNNEPADFSQTNIDVIQSNLGLHRYQILSAPSENLTISTKISATDTACNQTTDSGNGINIGNSWFITTDSNTSSANIQNEVQNVDLSFISQGLENKSYLSTFLTSVKESSLNSIIRASKYNFILENYNDENQLPQKGTNKTWYQVLYDILTKNIGQIDVLNTQDATIATTTSDFLTNALGIPISKYSTQHIVINGNLEILSNAICDTRSIFLVGDINSSNGGILNINPDFTIENSPNSDQMGCIFIAKNSINVLPGQDKNQNNSNLERVYDKIEGFFITDGQFNSNYNDSDTRDGLYIKGSVIANNINLTRQFGLLYDTLQPAEIFEYDARYMNIFRNEFMINKFKIREKDFIEKIYNK